MPKKKSAPPRAKIHKPELVVITGLSGSGKGSVLKVLEDRGFYAVDNLPVELIRKFAELTRDNPSIPAAALVVDVREGAGLKSFPKVYNAIQPWLRTRLIFLEADDAAILRRFSETRRPHPLGKDKSILKSIRSERAKLAPIRSMADLIVDTSRFTPHELRDFIGEQFEGRDERKLMIHVISFGYRKGLPPESDLVFDVRFLPNPNYIPRLKKFTGAHPSVAKYIRSFPQTVEFIRRISDLLTYLIPHYVREGKTYLTIAFGCTGGQHRSVMIAGEIARNLSDAAFKAKLSHRDAPAATGKR